MFVNNSPWIWLIPFSAILIIITSWVMIVRHFQHRVEKILKGLRFALRDFQSRRKLLERQSRNYSVRDPEPFRSLSTRLREAVAILRHRLDSLERRLVALHERHTILKSNRWRAFFGNPFAWHNLHSKAAQLHTEIAAAKLELLKIQELLEELEQVPWQVAGQIRELHRNLTTAAQLLGWQQTRGLQGKTFEAALIQCQEIDSAIQHAPILFLEGEKTSLLQSTEKASTSMVFEIVRSNRTVLEQLVQQARSWEKDYLKTADSVFAMRQALDALNQELIQVPPGLIIQDEGAESPRLEELAQDLQVTASQLQIESLSFVRQEADRLTAAIVEQTRELQRAGRELEIFRSYPRRADGRFPKPVRSAG